MADFSDFHGATVHNTSMMLICGLETYLANAQVIFFITEFYAKWQQINVFKWRWAKPESLKLRLLHKEGVNQKKQNMWTTSYNGIDSGYQHFSHLGLAASFVQNQGLAYKLVDR